jgi:sugar/nucleoside kinase (ribokinase family)
VDKTLGGSANYFSLAASLYSPVRVIGVVGEDYSEKDMDLLVDRKVDVSGLQKVPGKTFFWAGEYKEDMNEAHTLKTELNVFEHFNPKLPESFSETPFVFLANIAPELQLEVLSQIKKPLFVGCDTMNFWISIKKPVLEQVFSKVDVVLINEGEAKMFTGTQSAIQAAPKIVEYGPRAVVIKRGEYGFVMYTKEEGYFILPAYPVREVVDPTGAGDTFAGGFFGYLSSLERVPTIKDMRKACIKGSMLASFTIQDFGLKSLAKADKEHVLSRMSDYDRVVSI